MPPWQKSGELPYSHGRLSSVVCAMLPLRPAIMMLGALTAHGSGYVFLAFGYFVQISLNLSCMYYTTPWKYCNPQKAGKGVSLWRAKAVQGAPVQNDPNCPTCLGGRWCHHTRHYRRTCATPARQRARENVATIHFCSFVLFSLYNMCKGEHQGHCGMLCRAAIDNRTNDTIQTNQPAEQTHKRIAIGGATYDDTLR